MLYLILGFLTAIITKPAFLTNIKCFLQPTSQAVKHWGNYSRFSHLEKQLEVPSSMLLPGCKNKAYPLPSRNSESDMYKGCNDNSKLITPRRQYSARGKGILGPVISKQGAESAQPFMCPLGLLMWPPRH